MNAKKGLLAAATVTTLTLAGTGFAAAEEGDDNNDNPSTGAPEEPGEGDKEDEETTSSIESSTESLEIINNFGGAIAGSISILPDIYSAVQDFQDMVDDISSNLPPFPKLPALPF